MSSNLEKTHDLPRPLLPSDAAEDPGTVSIDLNFKAFADNVPTTEHARRTPNHFDPSIQDFADQVLELAALRAESKRLARDNEILQQQGRLREARMDELRRELSSARAQLRQASRQQSQGAAADVSEHSQPLIRELTSTLELPLTAAVRPASLPGSLQSPAPQLVAIDQVDHPIVLARDILTIGRARTNDICISSPAVSRDHARLLVAPGSVTLVDVSNTNGCFVNDERVKRHRLRDGDLVRLGDRRFRFVSAPRPQPGTHSFR